MNNWENLVITREQLGDEIGSSTIIFLPKNSKYKDYYFFHPSKLIRSKSYYYTFAFTNDFKFKIKKNGQGKWNKFEVLKEEILSADEIKEIFEKQQKIDK